MQLAARYVPVHLPIDESPSVPPEPGTPSYYAQRLGGPVSLAQLYLEAGLLHVEGVASSLLSSSYSSLSSIRIPHPNERPETATEAWKRDRESARRYFQRAKALCPTLDVPALPGEEVNDLELVMPSIELHPVEEEKQQNVRRHGVTKEKEVGGTVARTKTVDKDEDDFDSTWYLYVPGLVGAGTALLVVGVIGALSVSSWRKSQG